MLREHIGADTNLRDVLPLMSAGELVLKNRFLRSALPPEWIICQKMNV